MNALNLLMVVLATCSVVLGISYVAMLLLNKDIDAAER
jgi:hypothetical protein